MSSKPLLYSYIRFSTLEQAKGHSLNRQMSFAREVAREKGLELDESLTMRDMGLSAYHKTNITRGALGLFLAAVEQGRVPAGSILVIESLDRISRAEPLESQGIVARIINANITVITAADRKEYNKETIKANPMDLVYIILILIRANEESEIKSTRVRSALTRQCEDWLSGKRGFRIKCGKAPNWVRWDDTAREFVFNPREQAIMLRKVELFKRGFGGLKIAELLNTEFGPGTVHHTGANIYKEVKRRTLIGELNVKVGETDYVLENYFPPLISVTEFEKLVSDSSNRGATKYSQKFVGILAGIKVFKCGQCGKSVGSHVIYRNKCIDQVKSSHKRYGCVEARRNNNCHMKQTIQIDVVEGAVVRFCQDKVNLRRLLVNGDDRVKLHNKEIELNTRLKKIHSDIDTLTEALLALDEPPHAIAKKIKLLEAEATNINQLLLECKNKLIKFDNVFRDEVTDRWLALTGQLSELGHDDRLMLRQLVKDTFKSITLNVIDESDVTPSGIESFIDAELKLLHPQNCFDLVLEFHNGNKRLLRLDRHSGRLLNGFDLE